VQTSHIFLDLGCEKPQLFIERREKGRETVGLIRIRSLRPPPVAARKTFVVAAA
jgi:hypothetical protein